MHGHGFSAGIVLLELRIGRGLQVNNSSSVTVSDVVKIQVFGGSGLEEQVNDRETCGQVVKECKPKLSDMSTS